MEFAWAELKLETSWPFPTHTGKDTLQMTAMISGELRGY